MNVVVKEKLEAKQEEEGAYLKEPQAVLPKMAYSGRLRPKGTFFRLQVYERAGKVACERTQKG